MYSDSDIVRLTYLWPGIVADVLDYAAALAQPEISLEAVGNSGRGKIEPNLIADIFSVLVQSRVFEKTAGDKYIAVVARVELFRLSQMLRGAEHFKHLKLGGNAPQITVTMPMSPSHLEQQLSTIISSGKGYVTTRDAFFRIARASHKRFAIMSPYLDKDGFSWLQEIYNVVKPGVKKVLILRDSSKHSVALSMQHSRWLNDMDVAVMDYYLSSRERTRALGIETFHAKIVLGDDLIAYVGSANVLGTGEGTSLEVGVTFEDYAASQIAKIIDGVIRVSRKLN